MTTGILIIGDLVTTDNGHDEIIGFDKNERPIMKHGGLSATFKLNVIGHVWSDMERMAEPDLPIITLHVESEVGAIT